MAQLGLSMLKGLWDKGETGTSGPALLPQLCFRTGTRHMYWKTSAVTVSGRELELELDFIRSPVLFTREGHDIMEESSSSSCAQANYCEIRYYAELIWSKPLTLGQKGMTPICLLREASLLTFQMPPLIVQRSGYPSVL